MELEDCKEVWCVKALLDEHCQVEEVVYCCRRARGLCFPYPLAPMASGPELCFQVSGCE